MSELLAIQKQFQNYLMHSEQNILECIENTRKVSAKERLAIYAYAYKSRLTESLADSFPVLNTYLGAEQFEEMASAYLDCYPSTYRSIRWFGDTLSVFLNDHTPYKECPYLAELAQFEWEMTRVFDAKDDETLHIEDIAKIPPESWVDMYFATHPSVKRLNMSWNVVQIWQDMTAGCTPVEPAQNPTTIFWVLWRRDLINRFCSLSKDEAWAIDAMLNNSSFGEICAGLCQWFDEYNAALRAAALLKAWVHSGLISTIEVK